MAIKLNWLDRAIGLVAPERQLRRLRARVVADVALRHYEGAAVGRRTQNWNRASGDANAVFRGATLARLREVARDLVRNNPYAESALTTIGDHAVGDGIVAKPKRKHDAALRVVEAVGGDDGL
jgi:capsid protein